MITGPKRLSVTTGSALCLFRQCPQRASRSKPERRRYAVASSTANALSVFTPEPSLAKAPGESGRCHVIHALPRRAASQGQHQRRRFSAFRLAGENSDPDRVSELLIKRRVGTEQGQHVAHPFGGVDVAQDQVPNALENIGKLLRIAVRRGIRLHRARGGSAAIAVRTSRRSTTSRSSVAGAPTTSGPAYGRDRRNRHLIEPASRVEHPIVVDAAGLLLRRLQEVGKQPRPPPPARDRSHPSPGSGGWCDAKEQPVARTRTAPAARRERSADDPRASPSRTSTTSFTVAGNRARPARRCSAVTRTSVAPGKVRREAVFQSLREVSNPSCPDRPRWTSPRWRQSTRPRQQPPSRRHGRFLPWGGDVSFQDGENLAGVIRQSGNKAHAPRRGHSQGIAGRRNPALQARQDQSLGQSASRPRQPCHRSEQPPPTELVGKPRAPHRIAASPARPSRPAAPGKAGLGWMLG